MMRLLAFAFAAYCYLQPVLALAEDTARRLAGSWKLNSWTIQIIGGEVSRLRINCRRFMERGNMWQWVGSCHMAQVSRT